MDFKFLFDGRRKLFSIGYQQSANSFDNSYYDLLASESRLASFIAIAKDDVSVDHWFKLGRSLTSVGGTRTLISWSGSMFEYLMPATGATHFPVDAAQSDTPGCSAAADLVRRGARRSVGNLRVGVQRSRPGLHVSVSRLRRAGSRAQARAEPRSRGRSICNGTRDTDRASSSSP